MSGIVRLPAVAGSFYPASPAALATLVDACLAAAVAPPEQGSFGTEIALPLGILVPHAGLVYSGTVAAAGWRLLAGARVAVTGATGSPDITGDGSVARPPVVVILGTNHTDASLSGVAAWDGEAWQIPLARMPVDQALVEAILGLGEPFVADPVTHTREHSIEVQLPVLARVSPAARIVPLSVAAGTGPAAVEAGLRLGSLLGERRAAGEPIVLAISTDMAHYPPHDACRRISATLLPPILDLDPERLAAAEASVSGPGVSCGMCGIEPTVVGLAALAAMGARHGAFLAAATSADAGGDPTRTVGYVSVAFGVA